MRHPKFQVRPRRSRSAPAEEKPRNGGRTQLQAKPVSDVNRWSVTQWSASFIDPFTLLSVEPMILCFVSKYTNRTKG